MASMSDLQHPEGHAPTLPALWHCCGMQAANMAIVGRLDPPEAVQWVCTNNVGKEAELFGEPHLETWTGWRSLRVHGPFVSLRMRHSTLCIAIHLNSSGAAGALRDFTMQCVLQASCGCAAPAASIRQQSLLAAQPCMSAPRRQLQAAPQQRQRQQRRTGAVVVQAGGGFGKPAEKALSKQKVCPCGTGLAYKASRVDLPAELYVGPPQGAVLLPGPSTSATAATPCELTPCWRVWTGCVQRAVLPAPLRRCCRLHLRHRRCHSPHPACRCPPPSAGVLPAVPRSKSAACRRRSCARATLLMSRGCGSTW